MTLVSPRPTSLRLRGFNELTTSSLVCPSTDTRQGPKSPEPGGSCQLRRSQETCTSLTIPSRTTRLIVSSKLPADPTPGEFQPRAHARTCDIRHGTPRRGHRLRFFSILQLVFRARVSLPDACTARMISFVHNLHRILFSRYCHNATICTAPPQAPPCDPLHSPRWETHSTSLLSHTQPACLLSFDGAG